MYYNVSFLIRFIVFYLINLVEGTLEVSYSKSDPARSAVSSLYNILLVAVIVSVYCAQSVIALFIAPPTCSIDRVSPVKFYIV